MITITRTLITLAAATVAAPAFSESSTHSEPPYDDTSGDLAVARNADDVLSSNRGLRLAYADDAPKQVETEGSVRDGRGNRRARGEILEEIVVTAQKREESLQDVPVPVTVINAQILAETNQVQLKEYYSTVPGFSLSPAPGAGGQQMLSIRGISTGAFSSPTVGVTVDGVPYGASTGFTGNVVPDLDPSDLSRVEVLRGPQGTLYGANSLGGLVNFVTTDPSPDALTGRIEGSGSSVSNGSGLGYSVRGAMNVPLSDKIAIRASAFTHRTPGYIDNVVLDEDGVNEERVGGGRLSAIWQLSENLSLKLNALYQDDKVDGLSEVTEAPGLGDWQQNYNVPLGSQRTTEVYSATVRLNLGSADVTSISAYNENKFSNTTDSGLGFLSEPVYGVSGAPLITWGKIEKFFQEIRVSIPIGQRWDWLVGGYYTRERAPRTGQKILAAEAISGTPVELAYEQYSEGLFKEYAAFTNLTLHVSDRFEIQVGGRQSKIEAPGTGSNYFLAPLFGVDVPLVTSNVGRDYDDSAFTYLFSPQFKISPDLMVYARLASGYRAGGGVSNPNSADLCVQQGFPCDYRPDKTENYEIGVNGDFLDQTISVRASIYYIDWKEVQINVLSPGPLRVSYNTNGGRARSQGVEVEASARPTTGLTISGWVTWAESVLTEDFPPNSTVYGIDGSRLPFSSRFSGNFSLQQEFPLANDLNGFVGASLSYVGNRLGTFVPSTALREEYPDYTKLDLSCGARYSAWTATLYANNVLNERGLLGGGTGTFPPNAFTYIQPRTIGLAIARTF